MTVRLTGERPKTAKAIAIPKAATIGVNQMNFRNVARMMPIYSYTTKSAQCHAQITFQLRCYHIPVSYTIFTPLNFKTIDPAWRKFPPARPDHVSSSHPDPRDFW